MNYVLSEVLMAVTVKITMFWNVTPCSLVEVYWRFGGTCYLRRQASSSACFLLPASGFLGFFYPEGRDTTFLEKLMSFYRTTRLHIPEGRYNYEATGARHLKLGRCILFSRKSVDKRPLGRRRLRLEDNIKMNP
jgi:hypothetical protein